MFFLVFPKSSISFWFLDVGFIGTLYFTSNIYDFLAAEVSFKSIFFYRDAAFDTAVGSLDRVELRWQSAFHCRPRFTKSESLLEFRVRDSEAGSGRRKPPSRLVNETSRGLVPRCLSFIRTFSASTRFVRSSFTLKLSAFERRVYMYCMYYIYSSVQCTCSKFVLERYNSTNSRH